MNGVEQRTPKWEPKDVTLRLNSVQRRAKFTSLGLFFSILKGQAWPRGCLRLFLAVVVQDSANVIT